MYKNKKVCAVIPCYNEESQIGKVIETMPNYVDNIVIVDDCSRDNTVKVVESYMKDNDKIILIKHEKNIGNGGARVTGLKKCLEIDIDIICLMDGDGQMSVSELPHLLEPIIQNKADYAKGNRFFSGKAWEKIPKIRYMGNAILSLITKIVSGYWHVADSQSGYIVLTKQIVERINLDHLYQHYGFPNDLLIHANVVNARVEDIPIEPIYNIGEKSGIKYWKVIPQISWLLFRRFFWRLKEKYIIRDFHPLVFFYAFGFFLSFLSIPLFIRIIYMWVVNGNIPKVNFMAWMFAAIMGMQFELFAMWFDMENNKELK